VGGVKLKPMVKRATYWVGPLRETKREGLKKLGHGKREVKWKKKKATQMVQEEEERGGSPIVFSLVQTALKFDRMRLVASKGRGGKAHGLHRG